MSVKFIQDNIPLDSKVSASDGGGQDFSLVIDEINNIDFSFILNEEFEKNKHEFECKTIGFCDSDIDMSENPEPDLSLLAGNIVTNTLHIPRSLYCPFCGDEYMFEFTLKDHLKQIHKDELIQNLTKDHSFASENFKNYSCPYCKANFCHIGLVPKHISKHHGNDLLQQWQLANGNLAKLQEARENEPSIIYAVCSPGLSEVFNLLDTNEKIISAKTTPEKQPRSILKKTPNSRGRIISSPSSTSIRRTKSEYVKRSTSVRRELRFDLPPIKGNSSNSLENKTPEGKNRIQRWRNFFKKIHPTVSKASDTKTQQLPKKILTSTPINFLDDDRDENNFDCIQMKFSKKNSRKYMKQDLPSFFSLERFQCARCRKTWDNNAELLVHLKGHHKGAKNFIKPHHRCGQCGATFYRNSFLVRHCHFHHTPIRLR